MPVKKGEKLTHLNDDSVSVTELVKLGKCELLIKVEKNDLKSRRGLEEHALFSEECRAFMGKEHCTWTKEKLLREERFRKNLKVMAAAGIFLAFLIAALAGYMIKS